MVRKLESGTLRTLGQVQIRPLPGYHMVRIQPGEYLVINDEDPANNVIVDADAVLDLLLDTAGGRPPMDEFQRGLCTMWTVERVDE